MKLIDKAAIVAEIEKRIEEGNKWADAAAEKNLHNTLEANELLIGQNKSLLSFIHTLEVKEVDLHKELSSFYRHSKDCGSSMALAKHFFELGLAYRKEE